MIFTGFYTPYFSNKNFHRSIHSFQWFFIGEKSSSEYLTDYADLPMIISGDRISYFDPQEEIWRGKSGRSYKLKELTGTDCLNPLGEIANFSSHSTSYNKTLFRFPLRTASSKLSENLYTVQKVNELTEVLKSEAKFLLLFLHSVHTIEVYNIDNSGNQTLSFQTKIGDASVNNLMEKRRALLEELKSSHVSQQYSLTTVLKFTAKFDVCVYDANTRGTSTSHWLVANQVGSSNSAVSAAAVKQKVFPWVGTAVEVGSPGNGRIFCFLPMPIETASNLPVHVNGTFGLTDDRRSLKWPGVERKNDPMADWNKMLVTDVMPSCYVALLFKSKNDFNGADFYKAWPSVSSLKGSNWEPLLSQVFNAILNQAVIFSKPFQQQGEWVNHTSAVFVPRTTTLLPVVERVLTSCGVKLADVPSSVRDAFAWVGVPMTDVNPKLARSYMRQAVHSYSTISATDKHMLLGYCLSDGTYNDLSGLQLLPLCNGIFQVFLSTQMHSPVYLCTQNCPRGLLPNLDHKLVDLTSNQKVRGVLEMVAKSAFTQLKELTVPEIPALIGESMPAEWRTCKEVPFPNTSNFPLEWFKLFWSWVQNKQLSAFADKFIMPVLKEGVSTSGHFNVVKLTTQPILYIPKGTTWSELALTVLRKFRILCCVQSFSFVAHKELSKYTNSFDSNGILKSISCFSGYLDVTLTAEEASCLRKLLCDSNTVLSSQYHHVLCGLKIFTSASNSNGQIYSVKDACHTSVLKESITLEVSNRILNISVLPADVVLFTSDEHYQKELLQAINRDSFMSETTLLTAHIFPCIQTWMIPQRSVQPIMTEVLDKFDVLVYHNGNIPDLLENIEFVMTSSGVHKCPKDLYDPDSSELHQIFYDAPVFPIAPYDKPQFISALRMCGLRTSIAPQEVLDTILKIGMPAQSTPQSTDVKKFSCARAILKYIGTKDFERHSNVLCYLPNTINYGSLPFSSALNMVSCQRCWLPILSSRPSGYSSQLSWKGKAFTSHLCSLESNVCVFSASKTSHPLMYGSQVYFTDPVIESDILTSQVSPTHLVAHLEEVVSCAQHFQPTELFEAVQVIYSAMLKVVLQGNASTLSSLQSVEKWIYLKDHNTFISPTTVALSENRSFHQNLEPYLRKLPESISDYSELFIAIGVRKNISESQIISVLSAMREDMDNDRMTISVDNCWNIVMAILNWLTENGSSRYQGCLDSLYIPIESDSQWPDLRPACEVVYIDNEFFKKFIIASETEKSLQFLHSRVNVSIAKCLQLTPLSKELDIAEDTFEDTGQHEPLTTRLKNILRDYKDGLTIIKEMIQNADDAEATEVNICFDARTHCQDTSKLFFPGMSESHGPALVIHNNSVFSDEDFKNITQLVGGTKPGKHLKIGRFGIGFCSVYHITDVPSFVTRDRLCIFDPTLAHLGKEIKNPALPGKKLQFLSRIIQNSKQLDPFDNLYQFNRKEAYNGTMFRLPFRTSASELSGKCYSEATALELLDDIYSCSESLIQFLQHVRTITYQRINNAEPKPTVLFTVHREEFSLSQEIAHQGISTISIDSEKVGNVKSSKYLMSQHSTYKDDKYAVASVACELTVSSGEYSVNELLRGEVFCFLPLSQSTGLPAHISCNFAVINNRRGIWTAEESASTSGEAEVAWNIFLMENVIPKAYLGLLYAIKKMHELDVLDMYDYYDLWPLPTDLVQKNPWSRFVAKLYEELSSISCQLFYCESQNGWKSMRESYFLQPNILNIPEPQKCIMDVLIHLKLPIVELPEKFRTNFRLADFLIDQVGFIIMFFSNLLGLVTIRESRNDIIHAMLESYAAERDNHSRNSRVLQEYMSTQACIPCSPDGEKLKKCSELIHPQAKFAKLYDSEEGMFPFEVLMKRDLPKVAMKNLGLIQTSLPWDYVVERAKTVETLMSSDSDKAYQRIQYIIEAITFYTGTTQPTLTSLSGIDFLPVMKKPDDFHLKWPGKGCTLSSGSQMMLHRCKSTTSNSNIFLAGSQSKFVCEAEPQLEGSGHISDRAQEILGLTVVPPLSTVLEHFMLIIAESSTLPKNWINDSCSDIYEHLNRYIKNDTLSAADALQFRKIADLPIVWNGDRFLCTSEICFQWPLQGSYLFKVPAMLQSKRELCTRLGIQETFSSDDIKCALLKMKDDFEERPVNKNSQMVIQHLIPLLQSAEEKCLTDGSLLLPDKEFCLHSSKDLAYNDAPWAPPDKTHIYVNDIIPRELARKLGVRPVRSKFLDKYSSVHGFKKFGQRENLTRRIQNILCDYPLDATLLKELIQNADDAKATKMYVILDKRFHSTTSILSEEWGDLQGPAMLVWNDSVFSEKDLEGIQELGLGSKRSEADTIGQYGIGFNVVYHVTDCPSFVSNDETLCIMDPHCRYTPGANELSPGRRFDKLNDGFWQDFPDMKSAYLRGGMTNLPGEVLNGSMFRFPIRHDRRNNAYSEIVDSIENSKSCLNAEELDRDLRAWMIKMKEAMLFLNNVTELRLFVIEEVSSEMTTVYHFKSEIEESAPMDRVILQGAISVFKDVRNSKSCAIMYPLTITEVSPDSERVDIVEKWLVQQGVGDIYEDSREWKYIKSVKPRHGIAAPQSLVAKKEEFKGQVFCFLPLPVRTGFPVHVNGHFILNSTRRELWKSTDSGSNDNRSQWNDNLILALSSSYADFLVRARSHYVSGEYKTLHVAMDAIGHYFSLFPSFTRQKTYWNTMAREVYNLILQKNHPVFCAIELITGEGCTTKWHPPKNSNSADQVYYWPSFDYASDPGKEVYPILESIGMNITPAPSTIMQYFSTELKCGNKLFQILRESVFQYYTNFSTYADATMQPTSIANTSFQGVKSYLTFTDYLLRDFSVSKEMGLYPKPPFGHFLLLTADETLRRFDQESKVLKSSFSYLFLNSLSCFLHPSLLTTGYTKSYFIQPEDNSDAINLLILQVIEENVPHALKHVPVVTDAVDVFSHDKLCSLWKCLTEDEVFHNHLPNILNQWALLLSEDDRVFSTTSKILPMKYDSASTSYYSDIYTVLKKIGLPFLDSSVVVNDTCCPLLSDGRHILSNLYHTNQERPLEENLDKTDLDIIISYLKYCEVMPSNESLLVEQVKSLPLYESIDGRYSSIINKAAYIWPDGACSIAYQRWLEGHDATFIISSGKWSQLGYREQLSIHAIEVEDLYCRFIFPHFHKLNGDNRYQHLNYIKELWCRCHHPDTPLFAALKQLKCISPGDDGILHRVSDFCDHTVMIFEVFPEGFMFLPGEYRDHEWLAFLQNLGLKQTVSQQNFLQFCHDTSTGKTKECSKILLEYLCSQNSSSMDVRKISEIPFLFQAPLPKLSWVVPTVFPPNQMVKLNGSAPLSQASLLWTLKPIIKLPSHLSTAMKKGLGITTNPSSSNIINNIRNICEKSRYAQQELFPKYPQELKCPKDGDSLLLIMAKNLLHLSNKQGTKFTDEMRELHSLPCIPVYSTTGSDAGRDKIVLVKPCQVVYAQWDKSLVNQFHPYLHCLPDELQSFPNLEKIGIKCSLELCHVQTVLQSAYEASRDFELDPNTEICVKLAVQMLARILKKHNPVNAAGEALSPLFLPDSENKLKPSKSLLYGDTINYWRDFELDLNNVPYFHFNIKLVDYKNSPYTLCRLLPESVRPVGLSTVSDQVFNYKPQSTDNSDVALQLLETLKIPDIPAGIASFVCKYIGTGKFEPTMSERATKYLASITVTTILNLKTQIILKESHEVIGSMATSYWYVPSEEKSVLYLDSELVYPMDDDDAYLEIGTHMCGILCQLVGVNPAPEQENEISSLIKKCLKATSTDKVRDMLLEYGINVGTQKMHTISKKLGEEIPRCWHHRLEQDIDNVFNPMEYVGYEDKEGHIIIAQIVYPEFLSDRHGMEKSYTIYARDDDTNGEKVSFLSLYKFLASSNKPENQPIQAGSSDVVIFHEDDEALKLRTKLIKGDLLETKRKICKQLQSIWKLAVKLKNTALRRLYLKWHPDKHENPNEAERIFKFLMKQIEHLEKEEPLENPDTDVMAEKESFFRKTTNSGFTKYYYQSKYQSMFDFESWNGTAHNHSSASYFEQSFFGEDGPGLSLGKSKPTTTDYFPFDKQEDERKPEEGKRWVYQASTEFEILKVIYKQAAQCSGFGYVCFLAHQVAEKALKGCVYSLCGMDGRSINDHDHNLSRHAYALQTTMPEQTKGLAQHCITLESYYLDTRYPNRWPDCLDTPSEHYSQDTARQAQDNAKAVLDIVKTMMH